MGWNAAIPIVLCCDPGESRREFGSDEEEGDESAPEGFLQYFSREECDVSELHEEFHQP